MTFYEESSRRQRLNNLTDNRLRALRAWTETDHRETDRIVLYLIQDLINGLEKLAGEARRRRDSRSEEVIRAVMEEVRGIDPRNRWTFAEIYSILSINPPKAFTRISRVALLDPRYPRLPGGASKKKTRCGKQSG